jgi:hypothetical protein
MSVEGTWNLVIKGPTGPMSTKLELTVKDGVVTGTQSGQGTTTEIIDARFDGTTLTWVNMVTKPMKLKCEFNATVDGTKISGKMKAGFMGSFGFAGEKAA